MYHVNGFIVHTESAAKIAWVANIAGMIVFLVLRTIPGNVFRQRAPRASYE
jgi:hypothetical protein